MKLGLQKTFRIALFAPLLSSGWVVASAQQSTDPQADNTKMNQRDRNSNEATADQQKANRSDRDITQQIRKSIASDKSLSPNGHNVKVHHAERHGDTQGASAFRGRKEGSGREGCGGRRRG
jgi:hypothetical protein